MNENKETSLVIKNDNFFSKVKEFFKLFFSYFGIEGKEDLNSTEKSEENNTDDASIQKMTDEEYEKKFQELLLELQIAYENDQIKEEELNNEQIEDLKKLYTLQINYLNDCIERNEAIILKLKEKVEILNVNKK